MNQQREYCSDCENVFNIDELHSCICWVRGNSKKTIVTKSGVRQIDDAGLFCKNCLQMKHQHIGESFI